VVGARLAEAVDERRRLVDLDGKEAHQVAGGDARDVAA
jgi:hypothetical protein